MYDGNLTWSHDRQDHRYQESDGMVEEQLSSKELPVVAEGAERCVVWVAAFLLDLRLLSATEIEAEADVSRDAYMSALGSAQSRFESEIYTQGWRRLVKYASSPARTFRLGDEVEDLAFEACQEATLKFISRLQKLWPAINFPTFAHIRSYFFVIARHCLVDVLRKRKRQAQAKAPAAPAEQMRQDLAKQLPALQHWTGQELQSKVRDWLASIDETCDKRLIEGRFFESPPLSYKDIAASLNAELASESPPFTVGQLRVRKHRLTRDLLRCLTEECQSHDV